ncbi:P1 family peptidase [Stappia taiwanensis]|uniref:P1 family peptidase n=1 Tax=Stappia taiwanensis TaxID=992267 RepID=A0A838XGK1_9HYPH|nr:P1 family peptidase [Stappia taiwanensis]MBA4610519.1 P1 family peptidase [Stappia taiwanensis]GGE84242.1 peptidase T4 [Stappia taiwanensis]
MRRNLITDVPGLKVGNADNPRLKSGVTVLLGDAPFTASVAIHGGAPGTREVALLDPQFTVNEVDALVLSGGSAFGLDAGAGVQAELAAMGRGFAIGSARVPIAPTAILFDLLNGGDKDWGEATPYRDLGRQAVKAAAPGFELGTSGAGAGATTATLKGGLGSASARLDSGATIGALVAVNALGSATIGDTPHFWAAPFEQDGEFGGLGWPAPFPQDGARLRTKLDGLNEGANTTIAVIATDLDLTKAELKRLAVMTHDGFARALWPAHTALDGDLVFALSTGQRKPRDPLAETVELGAVAAAVMSRAIARGVHAASAAPGDVAPTWHDRFSA